MPIDPITGAALVEGGASLLGGLMGNSAQSAANRAMLKNAREERAWNERMSNTAWQRGTKDMIAAGINPNLAFSQGGASTPTTSAAGVIPEDALAKAVTSAGGGALQAAQTLANIEATKAQAKKTTAEGNLIGLTTESTASKVKWESINAEITAQEIAARIHNLEKSGALTAAQTKQLLEMLPGLTRGQDIANQIKESEIPSARAAAEFWQSLDSGGTRDKGDWLRDLAEWIFKARNATK